MTQMDQHRVRRASGNPYRLEHHDGAIVRVVVRPPVKRDPRFRVGVFPHSGGTQLSYGYGANEAEARVAAGLEAEANPLTR